MVMSPQVSWLFFKARAKRPYLSHTGRASNAEKQPTGRGPEGCVENGPAAALLVGYVPHQFLITAAENRSGTIAKTGAGCALLAPCRRPILNATPSPLYARRCTSSKVGHSVSSFHMSVQVLIVDGHSVIFAWPELRALHDNKTASARDRLTRILTEYQDLTGTNVVLVFDGRGPVISHENEPGGIQVFYSNTGHTADDIIERLVAKYGTLYSITVATSDLLEQQTAIAFGGNCISADGLRKLVTNARSTFARELKRRNAR